MEIKKEIMDEMKMYVKEREKAFLTLDKEKIDRYLKKYGIEIPKNEKVYWAGIHKAILEILNSTEEQKKRLRRWLEENGFRRFHGGIVK